MAIRKIFSKRQRIARGEFPDVYVYDSLPDPLRVQVVFLWQETLGVGKNSSANSGAAYQSVVETLRTEYGKFLLPYTTPTRGGSHRDELVEFFLKTEDVEEALDAIELTFLKIDTASRKFAFMGLHEADASRIADDAISQLNARFKEHGVGYQFVNQQIVRVDSELIHRSRTACIETAAAAKICRSRRRVSESA